MQRSQQRSAFNDRRARIQLIPESVLRPVCSWAPFGRRGALLVVTIGLSARSGAGFPEPELR
eukprot:1102695-Alexandrium_andersonii.AAC.1